MVIKEIAERRSVRDFKTDMVSEENIIEIVKAAQFAPTSTNNKSVEFVIVKNQEMKSKICDAAIPKQQFVNEAPVLIIPAIDTKKSVLPFQDLSIASENIFIQASEFGLGSVWKNLTLDQADRIKRMLNIPESYLMINIIPIGYPKNKTEPHDEADFSKNKIHYEKW
ncbi:MAG: nitroreductase family protein [Candidatus Bathyarchaeota archaeon]